jgi:curli production assembly/transport component CsgG
MRLYITFFLLIFFYSLVVVLIITTYWYRKSDYRSNSATTLLKDLPKPKEQIVVGLYNLETKPGNIKLPKTEVPFSSNTQGATSILIKALEDSKWFVPIERENIGNLLQENLIRSTRQNIQRYRP